MGNMMGFKDGDKIVANRDLFSREIGRKACVAGGEYTVSYYCDGFILLRDNEWSRSNHKPWGYIIYKPASVFEKEYDATNYFRLKRSEVELTVAQIEEKLGYGVKIVK